MDTDNKKATPAQAKSEDVAKPAQASGTPSKPRPKRKPQNRPKPQANTQPSNEAAVKPASDDANKPKHNGTPQTKSNGGSQQRPKNQSNRRPSSARGPKKPVEKSNAKRLRVIPLGGLDGIGKNMTVFEYGDDMIVVDAGLMFPDDDHPGIDLILPDFSYIRDHAEKLRAIVITHGHEDHTGALPYVLKDLGAKTKIVATKLTLGLIRGKLSEHGFKSPNLQEVVAGEKIKLGVFELEFIAVNHSIPDAVAIFIKTPVGNVLHTGDFKFDQTPIDGRISGFAALARAGETGVMLLLSDSTNAESSGFTRSEAEVGKALMPIIANAQGKVIVASFSSHIHRLQQICDAAVAAKRKVVVTGRSMVQNTKIARELGFLKIDDKNIVDAYELKKFSPKDIVVLCTGSQGEPLSALSRMAAGEHRSFSITAEDTIILSATPVPGNEKAVSNVINMLTKSGADVYDKRRAAVHVSGHAAAEELKLMLNMTKPEYFIPVHGETRQLAAHRTLAKAVGIPEEYIFLLENGDVLEFDERGAVRAPSVSNGIIYVDGLNVGDLDSIILRDRQHMSQDGMVTIVLTINKRKAQAIGEPQIVSRGIVFPSGSDFTAEVADRATKTLERVTREKADIATARRSVRDSVSQLIWEKTKHRPMVTPVIIEV